MEFTCKERDKNQESENPFICAHTHAGTQTYIYIYTHTNSITANAVKPEKQHKVRKAFQMKS